MRRASMIGSSSVSGSRASRAIVGMSCSVSSVSQDDYNDDHYDNDGFSALSSATGTLRSSKGLGRRREFHGTASSCANANAIRSRSSRRDQLVTQEGQNGPGSLASSRRRNGGVSLGGDRRSIRVRSTRLTTTNATNVASLGAAAPAPLEPSLRAMSVVVEGSSISFCCYNEDQNEITMETCTASGYETEAMVERFLQVARPNMILVGNRIVNNIPLLDMLTRRPPPLPGSREEGQAVDDASPSLSSIPYRLLKSGTFDVRACKKIILQKLKVLSMRKQEASDETAGRGRHNHNYHPDPDRNFQHVSAGGTMMYQPSSFHYLAAVIDFDSKVLVQALGALLSYLQSTVFQLEEGKYIIINRIVEAKTSAYMVISQSTFSALHIFSTEHHPLIAKGHGHSKEGFSLYSLLDRTKSRGGRQLLREWMLKPLISLEGIRTRQDATELFLQSGMQTSVGVLLGLLPKVGPIDKILIRIQKCATKPQDFLVLTTSLSAAISIASVLRNDVLSLMEAAAHAHSSEVSLSTPLAFQFFSELHLQCNVEALIDLRERINRILDSELMMENKGSFVVIHHGFHEQLDAWKEEYECLEDTLREVAKDLFHKHGQLDGLSVVFIPEVGYLVELEENLISHAQITLPCDFERIFVQDSNIYFKCDEMRDLDEDIGDLDGIIKDTERMIVTGLEETILDTENELRECFKALSSLDCILSFADCAADLNFTRPHLIDDDGDDTFSQSQHQQQHQHQHQQRRQLIYIKDGRHPLQEIICEREFVRNDVKMDDLNRILCVTGPNYSGKSCYMRQVGLLVYMAHLGSFVPCSKAIISVTDQIFARVSTTETCSRPQSSYQLELTEMASILLKATPKSLVLIDEFGKGTNPASGIAILGAALKKLSTIRCKTVCTTHFLELFTMNVIVDCKDGIRARRMTIHLPKGDEEDGAAPLFKLEDGVASSSAGLVCAKNAGVAHAVIDRAKQIIQIMRARKIIRPLPEATKQQVPTVSESEKEMLKHFVSMDSWERSNDEDIMKLLQLLANLSPNG